MAKFAAPAIPNGGSIIFTGSTAGSKGGAGMSVYSATKAAVRSLARTLAAELAPLNIRVNVISPGVIETPILGKVGLTKEQLDGWLESSKQRVPLGRIGRPEEVAATALYLAADATFTTGAELLVGGATLMSDAVRPRFQAPLGNQNQRSSQNNWNNNDIGVPSFILSGAPMISIA